MNISSPGKLSTPLERWGDAIGRWNPQLLRELRGTLTAKSVMAAVILAIALQALVGYIGLGSNQDPKDILLITRVLWLILMALVGSTTLVNNWSREVKLGTLDFLRLSPEPAWRILLGKFLGAPALCFVAAIAWLPFHLYLVIASGSSLVDSLVTDIVNVAMLVTFYSSILTLSTWAGKLNLSWAYLLGYFIFTAWPVLILGATEMDEGTPFPGGLWWFGLDLSQSTMVLLTWGTGIMVAITAFCWSASCRRFNTPHGAPLLRRQVYQAFVGFNLLFLGFFWPIVDPEASNLGGWGFIALLWTMFQALAIWGTMPSRQQLMDWGRYQHFLRQKSPRRNAQRRSPEEFTVQKNTVHPPTSQPSTGQKRKNSWHPLIWNSNSPPFLVPVINLAITWVIWSPWAIAMFRNSNSPTSIFLLLGLGATTAVFITIIGISVWIAIKMPRAQKFWVAAIATICFMLLFSFGLLNIRLTGIIGVVAIPASIISVALARGALAQVGKSESQHLFDSPPQLP